MVSKPTDHEMTCTDCGRSWPSQKDLKRHRNSVHEKVTLHFCYVKGCPRYLRGFPRKDNLDRHILIHRKRDTIVRINSNSTAIGNSRGTSRSATEGETTTPICNKERGQRRGELSLGECEPTREQLLGMLREELEKQAEERKELEKYEEERKVLEGKLKATEDRIKISEDRVDQLIKILAKTGGQ